MSDNKSPENWINDYKVEDSGVIIPLSSIGGISKEQAGSDIRKVLFSLLNSINSKYLSIPQDQRPAKMKVNKVSGFANDKIQHTFIFTFIMADVEQSVENE